MASDDAHAVTRIARSLAVTRGNVPGAREYALAQWPGSLAARLLAKGVIDTGSVIGDADAQSASAAFIALAKRSSLLSIIDNVSPFAKVPYGVPFLVESGGAIAYWTQEAQPIPTTEDGFETSRLAPLKISALVVVTSEFLRLIGPSADAFLTRALQRAANIAEGASFIDPANAGAEGIEPASITHGAQGVESTGSTPAAITADLTALFAAFTGDLSTSVVVLNPALAVSLALMGAAVGAANLGIGQVGYLAGVPAVAHPSVPAGLLVLIDTAGIAVGERSVTSDASGESTVEVDDGSGTTQVLSLWQLNLACLRLNQYENWERLDDGAVAYLSGCFPAAAALASA